MTRAETKLHQGAEGLWPGSGDDLVTVYRAFTGRSDSFWCAAMIAAMLRGMGTREKALASLRERVPRAGRPGPKMQRAEAALAALDRLDRHANKGLPV